MQVYMTGQKSFMTMVLVFSPVRLYRTNHGYFHLYSRGQGFFRGNYPIQAV